ncbi:hypothetical protein K432DRAFT_323883 [Lepidopterella palustris CBS 459.81]|uniref:3'-phosphate/5'-hydroxy nucleic acid ligase n=1 Tax=Lepidopterella palustris CBS 459.81 TaxID=1314670 RepID=A0A8E2EEP3_9PEZI|nr:hypothetical protein K432DRAFT_323883 [Lepidopterella palustris CBS 459.81]
MAATRITIALNAKQSQKAPLLLPASASLDPDAPGSCHSLVVKAALSKLRLKKVNRIFVAGIGKELLSQADWKDALKDDITLLASAGEAYVGSVKEGISHPHSNPNCPVSMLAKKAPVDELSVSQLETTARTLPGLIHAVSQPDLHPGTKFPIGAIFVSKGWVHPPLIGGDIGCGMAWYKTKLSRNQVEGDKGRKLAEKLRGLEGPWRTCTDREAWLEDIEGSCSAGGDWDNALGTIGAGNHFAEIQVIESSSMPKNDEFGLHEDEVVLLVHSGSRGYGGHILKEYTSESHISLKEGSARMQEYMKEHDKACRWAKANRDLIALRFLSCLEPGEESWRLGHNPPNGEYIEDDDTIREARAKIQERKVVDIWHNNVERIRWPPGPPPPTSSSQDDQTSELSMNSAQGPGGRDYVYVHRKGAAPTYNPSTNIPLSIVPLPGSRGTPTIILRPIFSDATSWGFKNALSLAHGAGRSMSRAKALSSLSQKYKNPDVLLQPNSASQSQGRSSGEDVQGGTWVICDEKQLVWEEAPEAYKDVYAVCDDLVQEGVAEVVGWCRARVSYKVRNDLR